MLDQNGRAILHKAAMFDDVELLEASWMFQCIEHVVREGFSPVQT